MNRSHISRNIQVFSIIATRPVKPKTKQEGIMYSSNIDTMSVDEYLNSLNEIFESENAFDVNLNTVFI